MKHGKATGLQKVNKFWRWIDATVGGIFYFADRIRLTRRIVLGVAVFLTLNSYYWARHFAELHPNMDGTNLGLILGAVLGPVSLFTGYAYKTYVTDSRSKRDIKQPPTLGDNYGQQATFEGTVNKTTITANGQTAQATVTQAQGSVGTTDARDLVPERTGDCDGNPNTGR